MYFWMKKASQFASWMGPRGWRLWGTFLGILLWWFLPKKRRRILLDNLQTALGLNDEEARKMAKANCICMGLLLMEALALPKLNAGNIREWVTLEPEGEEYLKAAFSEGRGVLLVTAHHGNWEWMGASLALYGYPTVAVMTPQHNKAANQIIMDLRSGAQMILAMRADVREMVRHLRAGRGVGLLMDQYAPQSTIRTNFFGRETQCQPGAAVLARMQKAPVVPVFIHRLANGRHHLTVHPPKYIDETKEKEAAQEEVTKELMEVIESHIRQYPEEWFWLHDRWKTRGRERTTTD